MKVTRASTSALLLLMSSAMASAGPIEKMFGAQVARVPWGTSLQELVELYPGGDQYFASSEGKRNYCVADSNVFFGISRENMKICFFLDARNSVESAYIMFPYDQREHLLGALTLSFGPSLSTKIKDISIVTYWADDATHRLSCSETVDPVNGLLAVSVFSPATVAGRKTQVGRALPAEH